MQFFLQYHCKFFPIIEYSKDFFKQNLKEKSLVEIKKSYKNNDLTNSIKTVFEKDNYNFKGLKVKATNSFDAYYKFDIYKKIKNITGKSKVASLDQPDDCSNERYLCY